MDDGYGATTVMDGGGSRNGSGREEGSVEEEDKFCRCLASRHIFSVSRQSLMLEVVPPAISFHLPARSLRFPAKSLFPTSRDSLAT